jgi:adenosylcobinamide-phosphate synthase
MSALLAIAAVMLDWLLGEPRRWHPLVGFGWLAERLEAWLNGSAESVAKRVLGLIAAALLIAPPVVLAAWLTCQTAIGPIVDVLLLYFALGHRSLHDHARAVLAVLESGDEAEARRCAGDMVSRDSAALDPVSATVESVLENGNDGVFGALFWFFVAGGTGALLYRLANTLDAMWGYRNERFLHFGWAAARFDDVLNYLPARLTALSYAGLAFTVARQAQDLGGFTYAIACWRTQAPSWDSPNAGPVMAAGAGALRVTLGGPARYRGEWHERPVLGGGPPPQTHDIERALKLVRLGVCLWLAVFGAGVLTGA